MRNLTIKAGDVGLDRRDHQLKSNSLDFLELHPYTDGAFGGRLDDLIIFPVVVYYSTRRVESRCGIIFCATSHSSDLACQASHIGPL